MRPFSSTIGETPKCNAKLKIAKCALQKMACVMVEMDTGEM